MPASSRSTVIGSSWRPANRSSARSAAARPARAAAGAGELRPPRPAGGARAEAPPLGRVRGACPPPGISNPSASGVLGGASGRSRSRAERTDGRTHAREGAGGGGVSSGGGGGGGGGLRDRQRTREDGGGLGQALPGGVRQERARLLQEVQREHPQGRAPHGHHGAGAEAALCAGAAAAGREGWRRGGRRGASGAPAAGGWPILQEKPGKSPGTGCRLLREKEEPFLAPLAPGAGRGAARRVRVLRGGSGGSDLVLAGFVPLRWRRRPA